VQDIVCLSLGKAHSTNQQSLQLAHIRHYGRLNLAIWPPICAVMGGYVAVAGVCLVARPASM
jgi:hypothetical protein